MSRSYVVTCHFYDSVVWCSSLVIWEHHISCFFHRYILDIRYITVRRSSRCSTASLLPQRRRFQDVHGIFDPVKVLQTKQRISFDLTHRMPGKSLKMKFFCSCGFIDVCYEHWYDYDVTLCDNAMYVIVVHSAFGYRNKCRNFRAPRFVTHLNCSCSFADSLGVFFRDGGLLKECVGLAFRISKIADFHRNACNLECEKTILMTLIIFNKFWNFPIANRRRTGTLSMHMCNFWAMWVNVFVLSPGHRV